MSFFDEVMSRKVSTISFQDNKVPDHFHQRKVARFHSTVLEVDESHEDEDVFSQDTSPDSKLSA